MSLLLEWYFGPFKMFQLVSWKIGTTRIEAGSVVEIAKAHLSQSKFVHIIGDPTCGMSIAGIRQVDSWGAVSPIGVPEHWATDGAYVKVNCDATSFLVDVGWIAQGVIVIFFSFKNLNILCVKQSENKTTICLARLLFHNQVVVANSGVCPDWVPLF